MPPQAKPLPKPSPYAGFSERWAYGNDPNRKEADYDYLRDHIQAKIDTLHKFGTPYPDSPNWDPNDETPPFGPGWEQSLGFLANTGAAGMAGLGSAAMAAVGLPLVGANDLGEWLTYGNPPQEAPGKKTAGAQAADKPPGSGPYGTLPFDQSYSIPGSQNAMPQMPGLDAGNYAPDYGKTDALLEAGRPKPPQRNEADFLTQGGAAGLVGAAQGVDATKGWGAALGQLVSGYAGGVVSSKRQLDEEKLLQEQRVEEYNLKLAGVESGRAEALSRAKVDKARVQNEITMMQYKTQVAQWESSQPTVQVLGDGSLVSIGRDAKTGDAKVNRMGQADQFKIMQAVQAASGKGVTGSAAARAQILSQFGPAGAQIGMITELGTIPGVLRSLIPPDQLENFNEELQEKLSQAQGLQGTAQASLAADIERSLMIKYILGDPFARQRLNQISGN